jgi:glycosyltransferase involved in cell wall biosynthesis
MIETQKKENIRKIRKGEKKEQKREQKKEVTLLTSLSGGDTSIKVSGLSRYAKSLYGELRKVWFLSVIIEQTSDPPYFVKFLGKIIGKDTKTIFRAVPLTFPIKKNENLHCTSQTLAIPLLYKNKKKIIVTVHDIIPLATRQYKNFMERITYFFIRLALKRAAHIIADSEHTKKDIVKHVGYSPKKITVIYLGVDKNEFFEKKDKKEESTIIYVGSDAQRKNIELIIKAVAIIKKEMPDIRFIKIGQAQDNTMRTKLKKLAEKLNVAENIVWKDYVENLSVEYSKATMLVFPSLYEGFGFPILEAMACGCPVITTKRTSLPELAGDAALFIEGTNPNELAERIKELMTDKTLQKKLRGEGKKQAKKFTWEKCAKETIAVYQAVWDES